MANRFFSPDQQFADSTGAALSGAQLFFYTAGTSTKLNTYSDKALSVANANPVVLDANGRAGSIFLQNLAYKVVLAPSTDTDPPTSPIWTIDNVWTSDFSATAQFLGNNGNPNGSVAGTAGSAGVSASVCWDFTNKVLYVCTTTGNAASAVWTAITTSSTSTIVSVPPPSGRLTLQSATPVMSTDQVAATSVIYTPYVDTQVPIYNGSAFISTAFTEQTLTLNNPNHAASTIYDVFAWNNSSVVNIGTGPAWANSTAGSGARGSGASTTQLTMLNGHLVNAVSITLRNGSGTNTVGANLATYLGSILIDATPGQITCHFSYGQSRKFGIWNAFNRVPIILQAGDNTASWTYTSGTLRASNNNSANNATAFTGLVEEQVNAQFIQFISGNSSTFAAETGIGVNVTNTFGGVGGRFGGVGASLSGNAVAQIALVPSLGQNQFNCVEGGSTNAPTFNGTVTNMLLTVSYRG